MLSPQYKIVSFPVVDFMKVIFCSLVTQYGLCGSIPAHIKPDNPIVQLTEQTSRIAKQLYDQREKQEEKFKNREQEKKSNYFTKPFHECCWTKAPQCSHKEMFYIRFLPVTSIIEGK